MVIPFIMASSPHPPDKKDRKSKFESELDPVSDSGSEPNSDAEILRDPEDGMMDIDMTDILADIPSPPELPEDALAGILEDDLDAHMLVEMQQEMTPLIPPKQTGTKLDYSDPELMRAFYQRLFPFRTFFQWLNHSPIPSPNFSNREFAFTLPNNAYLRYQSFATADLLRRQCIDMLPSRFEIGPVYSSNPRDRKTLRNSTAFKPISKELVFDIDMTDYDPIRTCCTGAAICNLCWTFITMAIKVVDTALRDDFGFEHILWVYSGRRGAHAWVCDRRARELTDNQRKAITGYLELIKDSNATEKKVNEKRPLHPHVDRSLRILKGHFQTDILGNQNPWASAERTKRLVSLLAAFPSLSAALARKWASSPDRSSASKWADIDAEASSGAHDSSSLKPEALLETKQDIVLEYTYARLDAEVSKKRNHLLKSPFVIHPGTGRVCVPIDMDRFEDFDPLTVPTITELLQQIDEWDQQNARSLMEEDDEHYDEDDDDELPNIFGVPSSPPGPSSPSILPSHGSIKSEGFENDQDDAAQERREKKQRRRKQKQKRSQQYAAIKKIPDWDKTELKPYIDYFRLFVARLLQAENARAKREREEVKEGHADGEGIDF